MSIFVEDLLPRYEPPELDGVLHYRNEPVIYHGDCDEVDCDNFVYPGRRVVEIPGYVWPASRPEECPNFSHIGRWLDRYGAFCIPSYDSFGAALVLVCPPCGLDCT